MEKKDAEIKGAHEELNSKTTRPSSIESAIQMLDQAISGPAASFRQLSSEAFTDAIEQARVVAKEVDARVRVNPWPVIGGVAIGTFALGFVFAAKGKDKGSRAGIEARQG